MKYEGANQLGECQRCGQKGLARDLMKDGRNPQLLVFMDCYDPPHPAEFPFVPRQREGKAKYPIAPENLPVAAPVVSSVLDDTPPAWEDIPLAWEDDPLAWLAGAWAEGGVVTLTWTRPGAIGPRYEQYEIFRSTDDSDFVPLATNVIQYSFIAEVENTPETYVDYALVSNTTYRYYVEAVTGEVAGGAGKRARSNTVMVDIGELG